MKKLLFGLIATVMFGFVGSAQTKVVGVFDSKETTQVSSKIRVEINGSLHKTNPRRDGTPCECKACFGLCNVNIIITNEKFSVPKGNHLLTLYILEDLNYVEDIFAVDYSLSYKLNSNTLNINSGDYKYSKGIGVLKFDDGTSVQYYGKVVVNTLIN